MGRMLARIAAIAAGVAVVAGLTWGIASVTVRMQDAAGTVLGVAPVAVPGSSTPPTESEPAPTPTPEPTETAPAEPAPVQPPPAQPAPPPADDDDDDDDDGGEVDDD